MDGVGLVVLVALLFALLVSIAAVMVWQETRRAPRSGTAVYVLEDAVDFVHSHLPPDLGERLLTDDVRRILEWEVSYLQDQWRKRSMPVAGGPEAVDYIRAQAARVQRVEYPSEVVAAVLAGEAAYLQAIGAVGEPVRP